MEWFTVLFSQVCSVSIAPFVGHLPVHLGFYSRTQVQEEEPGYVKKPQQAEPNNL